MAILGCPEYELDELIRVLTCLACGTDPMHGRPLEPDHILRRWPMQSALASAARELEFLKPLKRYSVGGPTHRRARNCKCKDAALTK